ncbi:MAG TPA: hypothetical protein VFK88_08780 [Gallionella sp.]|nr:hypothetical protein [Gallionella sp.]
MEARRQVTSESRGELLYPAIIVLLAAILSMLSGCVSCRQASFYKSISNQEDHDIRTDFYRPDVANFDVDKRATFSVSVCGDKYLSPPQEANGLCISVLLAESSVMQLQDTKVLLTSSAGNVLSAPIEFIGYHIFCDTGSAGERHCTSTEVSPIKGTTLVPSKTTVTNLNAYKFAPNLPFTGAADTLEQGAWFGHRLTGWRRYYLNISNVALNGASEISVHLPNVIIDGQVHILPALKFRAVTEEVCHYVKVN